MTSNYKLENKLGGGNFGVCHRCISKDDNKEYAMKIISKEKLKEERIFALLAKNEINLQQPLNSPKIIKIKEYIEDKDNIYIIQEFCKNKTLLELLNKREEKHLTEIEVQNYIFQLIQGLYYLKMNNIIHRDIKPSNLLLDEKLELKIGDFGLSTKIKDNEGKKEQLGTLNFMAPEIWKVPKDGYSYEVDIWSMGIVMYNLLTGTFPFKVSKNDGSSVLNGEFEFPKNIYISKEAKNLIKQILVKDPKKRPSLIQIVYHDFFHKNKFPKFLDISTYDKPPSSEENKKYENTEENSYFNCFDEIIEKKLYNLVVEFEEEIIYENIEKYIIKEVNMDNYFNYWISEWKESKNEDIFYYFLNNGLKGIILENTNNQFLLDENNEKFYEINLNGKEEIIEHNLLDYPENLKFYIDELLKYSRDTQENNQFSSQDLFSEFSSDNIQNKLSNEISEIEASEELNSEINNFVSNDEIKDKKLIYVKNFIIENKNQLKIYLLKLSDGSFHAIFKENNENKNKIIEVLINYDKYKIGYIDHRYNYKTVVKLEKWRENPSRNFIKRIKWIRKMEADNIKKNLKLKKYK
jgi:serine/threonine protein kinase